MEGVKALWDFPIRSIAAGWKAGEGSAGMVSSGKQAPDGTLMTLEAASDHLYEAACIQAVLPRYAAFS
ncbi:hypothetical protein Holit_02811 [Hollandina sp. SP2]